MGTGRAHERDESYISLEWLQIRGVTFAVAMVG
jgi:hypothetical protein